MERNRLQFLHHKYLSEDMSVEELNEWKDVLGNPDASQYLQEMMDEHWMQINTAALSDSQRSTYERMYKQITDVKKNRTFALPFWIRGLAAAAVLVFIFAGGLLYFYGLEGTHSQIGTKGNDVLPGKQGATLTLANGEKILIKDALSGNIASQGGVKISKTANGQIVYEISNDNSARPSFNTLSTSRGEQIHLRLPDGSVVYLNAASSLTYPTSFAKADTRRVSLTGEGYFEIAKDKFHPFIVATATQEVQVLGTHFNINAYPDESAVSTTLVEGAVQVRAKTGQWHLQPGFQAVNSGTSVKIREVEIDNVVDWKDGDFNLDGLELKLAMRKIGRWYDVEVVYGAGIPDGLEMGGWISRKNNLSDVLKLIEKSGLVHFKLEGKKLYILK